MTVTYIFLVSNKKPNLYKNPSRTQTFLMLQIGAQKHS